MTAIDSAPDDVTSKIEEYLQSMTMLGKFSGAVLVARDGEIVYTGGYGLADREHGVPNTPSTKFRLASISKQFTATAILMLEEQGKLSVHDRISKYLPYSPDSWSEITIHYLLNHTSGLVRAAESVQTYRELHTMREAVDTFREKPLEFEPGTKFQYANTGYILLADIIERVSGIKYATFLRQNIFDPLAMSDSGCDEYKSILTNRATGYGKENEEWARSTFIEMWWAYGAGSIYSTVHDVLKWERAFHGGRLISRASYAKMTAVTPLISTYGYGVALGREHDRRTISHSGGIHGFRSHLVSYPDESVCVIVLSNFEDSDFLGVAKTLAAILFGEKCDVPPVKTPYPIARHILEGYSGVYELAPGMKLTVEPNDGGLVVSSGIVRRNFLAESETGFFRQEGSDTVEFQATHLTLRQSGVETTATKVAAARLDGFV